MPEAQPRDAIRFGAFEVDLRGGELRKHGIRVRLQDQPFKILVALLENLGEVVSRDELRQRIWGNDTFVDFDHGLSAAVNRLREALSDSAESPRYIETLARRGYRFIAPVEGRQPALPPAAAPGRPLKKLAWIAAALLAVGAVLWIWLPARETFAPQLMAVPLTALEGVERDPAFSPDASQVAFSWDGPQQNNFDIYVKGVGVGSPVRLTTDPAPDRFPAWSPDGRYIAFLREGHALYLIPPIGGTERKVFEWPGLTGQLAWSEDGRSLAFSRSRQGTEAAGIFAIPAGGGPAARLTTAEGLGYDNAPAYSPDGRWLAFARCIGSLRCSVAALSLENGVVAERPIRRLTEPRGLIDTLAWAQDSRSVLFSGPNPGTAGSRLWQVDLDGRSQPRLLSFAEEGSRFLTVSRSGSRLAFSLVRGDADVWSLGNGALSRHPISSTRLDYSPQFSPDGRRIVFSSSRSGNYEVWAANADGSAAVQLTRSLETSGSPRWSPDGRWIVYDTAEGGGAWDIGLIEASGGPPRPIASHPASDKMPSFSRDGRWIYFASDRGGSNEIYRVPAAGGEPVQLTDRGGAVVLESADGKSIYYTKEFFGCGPLSTRSLSGGAERQVLDGVCARDFEVTERGIYYVGGVMDDPRTAARGGGGREITIQLLDIATGRSQEIARSGRPLYLVIGMAVSPDRKTILFSATAETGADLMLVENFR